MSYDHDPHDEIYNVHLCIKEIQQLKAEKKILVDTLKKIDSLAWSWPKQIIREALNKIKESEDVL